MRHSTLTRHFCLLLLGAMLLSACNLPASAPESTPVVTQPGDPQTQPSATPEPTQPGAQPDPATPLAEDPASQCPAATADSTLYVSRENGLCFLYPAYFSTEPDFNRPDEVLVLRGPVLQTGGQEGLQVMLLVEINGLADGLTSAAYAARWQQSFEQGAAQQSLEIAGYPAVIVTGIPGFGSQQAVFIVANGYRYRLMMVPELNSGSPQDEHTAAVWNTVLDSLTFFVPQAPAPFVRAAQVCPAATADTRLFVHELDGYCYLYPAAFQEDSNFFGRIFGGPVVGSHPDFGELQESIVYGRFGYYPDQTPRQVLDLRQVPIDTASIQETTIGGHPAVVFIDLNGPWPSRQALISVNGFIYSIVAQPDDPAQFPLGVEPLAELWDTTTASAAFFTPFR